MPDYGTMTAEELAAEYERVDDEGRTAGRTTKRVRTEKPLIEAHLIRKLGDGEAVKAPSGRYVFKDVGGLGRREVNEQAIVENAESLPESCRAVETLKLPSIADLEAAEKRGELKNGLTVADLVDDPPEGSVLRWRTL